MQWASEVMHPKVRVVRSALSRELADSIPMNGRKEDKATNHGAAGPVVVQRAIVMESIPSNSRQDMIHHPYPFLEQC